MSSQSGIQKRSDSRAPSRNLLDHLFFLTEESHLLQVPTAAFFSDMYRACLSIGSMTIGQHVQLSDTEPYLIST